MGYLRADVSTTNGGSSAHSEFETNNDNGLLRRYSEIWDSFPGYESQGDQCSINLRSG